MLQDPVHRRPAEKTRALAPKVLIVSPYLGTPGPSRPWREQSIALLEALKEEGAEITLVVERSFANDLIAGSAPRSSASSDAARLAAIYRYLATGVYEPTLFYRGRIARLMALHAPGLLRRIARRQQTRADFDEAPIENDAHAALDQSGELAHLACVKRFLFLRRFYSSASLRAVYGTGPAEVDARNYDLVVVDGLFPVRVVNAGRSKCITVVHDLSAVTSPSIPIKLRRIAAQSLVTLAEGDGAVAFMADSVQAAFERLVGRGLLSRPRFVIGPMISSGLVGAAANIELVSAGGAQHGPAAAEGEAAPLLANLTEPGIIRRLFPDLFRSPPCADAGGASGGDSSLPYVVVSWSSPAGMDRMVVEKVASALTGRMNVLLLDSGTPTGLPPNCKAANPKSILARRTSIAGARAIVYPDPAGSGPGLLEAQALGILAICPDVAVNRDYGMAAKFHPGGSADGLVDVLLGACAAPQTKAPAPALVEHTSREFRRRYHDQPRLGLRTMLAAILRSER